MSHKHFRMLWGFSLLLATALACSISDIGRQAGEVRNTAQSAATDIQEGRELIGTVQSVATQIQGNELVQTAQAAASTLGPGAAGTARALATEYGPGAIATLEALATQQGPGLVETAQAFATQEGPGAVATLQTMMTQAAAANHEGPKEVPVVDGEINNLLTTDLTLYYSTPVGFDEAVAFYKEMMPLYGWQPAEQGNIENSSLVLLFYEKPGRDVSVSVTANPVDQGTFILITEQAN